MFIVLSLFLLALAFVMWPSFSKAHAGTSQQAENMRLYQLRREEILAADYSADEQESALLELDRELLSSGQDQGRDQMLTTASERKTKIFTAFGIFIAMISAVMFMYEKYGAQDELYTTQLLNKAAREELSTEEREALISGLEISVKKNPEHSEWRYLYARLLVSDSQFSKATEHFTQILMTLPEGAVQDRAAALVQRAQAKFYANQQVANADIYEDLQQALQLVPGHQQGLGLAGILAYELGQYKEALNHWKVLWLSMGGGAEAAALQSGIQRVVDKLEAQGESVDMSWMKHIELQVLVDISAELKKQLKPEDAVFVLAKAVTGPVMPLAAVRILASDLPQVVKLNDGQGMIPGMSLSQFEQVKVIARVAKGGQPIAQSGDFEGTLSPVATDDTSVLNLTIDRIVP